MKIPIPASGHFPPKEEASPAALDAVRYKYVLDTERVILARGHLDRDGGFVTLIQAMPRILERFPDAQLVVMGCGPALFDILSETHKLGIREQTVFPGTISDDDLAGLYQCCAVFAAPATQAGGVTPPATRNEDDDSMAALFLALAYGKAVVAGSSSEVKQVIINGETGVIVEPDQPAMLADAVVSLLADPALARRLGDNARRRIGEREADRGTAPRTDR